MAEELLMAEEESRQQGWFDRVETVSTLNHYKILKFFQQVGVNEFHFQDTTGYGYGDLGREVLEKLYAHVFGGEAALVRPQIISGTHALSLCLNALLRPGDTLLAACGKPYDTLATVIGIEGRVKGSLRAKGVVYAQVNFTAQGQPDFLGLAREAERLKPRICLIQRSRGYQSRPALSVHTIRQLVETVKQVSPQTVCLVDNCYGELVEEIEPPEVGADLTAGSLIKNPGGGLAPGGGYIVGREDLIDEIAAHLTAPGLGKDLGPFSGKRLFYQGLFQAPWVVKEALKGAILAARFFQRLGYAVDPLPSDSRYDIVQTVTLGSLEALLAFCRGLQRGGPVEADARPEPAPLPGYNEKVIMAGGTFIQGASLELSADAPVRPPFTVFLQGGISLAYTKVALLTAAQEVLQMRYVR
ncbi:MAG: aminotransferase class I/II-fold pyridoxal phosphate-dependent enzyme [Moorellaceae bacterium]